MFSVVIPLYNKASHIRDTVQSVLNQTYSDFEVIVVDDGSADGSCEIVKEIQDQRIRLLSQGNAGVSAARNAGVAAATSEFVCFLDADDTWSPAFLQEIVRLIRIVPGCVLYATWLEMLEPSGKIFNYGRNELRWLDKNQLLLDYPACLRRSVFTVFSSSVCVERSALQQLGGFDNDLAIGEDLDMWIRLWAVGRFAFSSSVLARYNRSASNRSIHQPGLLSKRIEFLRKQKRNVKTLEDRGLATGDLRGFLAKVAYDIYMQARDANIRVEAAAALRPNFWQLATYYKARFAIAQLMDSLGR